MRSAFLLLALVAAASATVGWQSGRQFVYEYRTRSATGIPELKNQVSGLGLRAKVIVQVKSPSELLVKMADLGLARIESETFSQGWRQELPLAYQPLQQEQAQGLQVPFKVLLRQGQVEAIEVESQEPVWSVNIKRGLVSQLSLSLSEEMRLPQGERQISGNGIEKMIASERAFEIEAEPAVSGQCRTRYTVVPLPEYVARQEEQDLPQEIKEKHQERPAYVITKSKDFSKCQQRPGFLHQGLVDETEKGTNGMDGIYKRYSSRTATTRYLIRGEPSHNFVVERVWSEDAFLVQPFATKIESVFVSTNQTLVLKEVEPIRNPMPEPQNAARRSLVFQQAQSQSEELAQFEQPEQYLRQQNYEQEQELERLSPEHALYPKLTQRPPMTAYSGIQQHQVPVEEIKEQVKQLVRETEENIQSLSKLNQHKPSHKIERVARALTQLNYEELKELYQELIPQAHPQEQGKKVIKQIYIDALAMAGTNPALVLLKEKIEKREIKGEQAAQIIMTFPQSAKTPTPELLRELVKMTKNMKEQENVWTTSMLAVSNLIHRACVNEQAQRSAYGYKAYKYCGRQEIEIILPYLKEQLYQTQNPSKQQAIVQAIANLGAPESLQVLRPVVRGELTQDKQVRSQAIWSLARLARQTKNQQVLKSLRSLLAPIYNSPVEPATTRIAAFMTILAAKPAESFYTEAATNTWFEQSQQVGQFVYKTLAALANSTYPSHQNASRMAQMALPLAKPFRLGAQYSQNILMTNAIPERQMASFLNLATIAGQYSLIPEALYFKTKMFLGGFDMPMTEMALHTEGFQRIINEFIAPTQQEGVSSGLDIQTRKDKPLRASLWTKIGGQFERIITMDTLRQWVKEGIVEAEGKNVFRVNYQKAVNGDDMEIAIPAENGLPVYALRKAPVLVSVQGKIEVELRKPEEARYYKAPQEIVIKTDLKPFICTTRMIESGIASPLTKEVFTSGHQTHGLVQLPGKMKAKLNFAEKEFQAEFERANELPSKVELIKFETFPYTASGKFFNFQKKNVRVVKVQQEFAKNKINVGQKSLGLDLEITQHMDEPSIDAAGMYHAIKPHTLQSALQFYAIPHTLKALNYEVTLNLPASETKEALLKVSYGKQRQQWNLESFEREQELEQQYQYKYGKQQFQEFAQKAQEYFSNPLQSMPECEEEQSPCRNIFKHQLARSPAARRQQQQALEAQSEYESNVHSVHAELQMNGAQPRRFRASFVVNQSPNGKHQKVSALMEQVRAGQEVYSLRAHGQMNFQQLPVQRQELIQADKTALGHFTVQIRTENQRQNTLQARVVLAQTEEQKRFAEQNPIAKECEKHENRDLPYSPACMKARYQATLLNKVILDLEAEQELPKQVRNMTYHLDDLVKYAFYPHMSQERVDIRNPEKKVKIVLDFKPIWSGKQWTVLNAKVYKPCENTFYSMLKLNPIFESFFPISARYETYEKAMNHIMGQQYTPSCKVQKQMIQTFDNVSIPYELNDCYHLVAKDCSKQVPVQVFAKRAGEGKQIKLNVGPQEVKIDSQRQVQVNGQRIQVSEQQQQEIKDEQTQQTILIVKRPNQKEVEVIAPAHGLKVRSDGKRFGVQMSNIFRGRTCGLCGDMNGEKTAELKDPKGCIRSQAETFGRSYAVGSCQAPPAQRCERVETRPAHYQESRFGGQQSQSQGVRYITKVENRGSEVCFSVKPVQKCALGHKPTNTVNQEMGFHCVHRGRAANELAARASQGIIEEMLGKQADFNEWISVPEACEQIEAY